MSERPEIIEALDSTGLPVNSIAMMNEIRAILDRNETNHLGNIEGEDLREVRAFLWVLNSQVHGQLATIDMQKEWRDLTDN